MMSGKADNLQAWQQAARAAFTAALDAGHPASLTGGAVAKITTPVTAIIAIGKAAAAMAIAARGSGAIGLDVPGIIVTNEENFVVVDGMDVIAVYEAAGAAIQRARSGQGPTLLECKTYRYYDHVGVRGMGLTYRTDEELEIWQKRDAIQAFEKQLVKMKVTTKKKIENVYARVNKDIEAGIKFAEDSPFPEPADLLDDVYNTGGAS